uniref:Uncharacterized protein n=1 Tax=Rhizophora mucronata TaxID=61149 RepID=A0A2P2PFM1_RHIMU
MVRFFYYDLEVTGLSHRNSFFVEIRIRLGIVPSPNPTP